MVQGKPEGGHGCLVAERLSDYIVGSSVLQKMKLSRDMLSTERRVAYS